MPNNLTWTTIAYKIAMEGEATVRIYLDDTEVTFEHQSDAVDYAGYLLGKGYVNVETYEKPLVMAGELDLLSLRRSDALGKLTAEEKVLLGL